MRRLLGGALAALLLLSPLAASAQTPVVIRKADNSGPLVFDDPRGNLIGLSSSLNATAGSMANAGIATVRGYLSGTAGGDVVTFQGSNDAVSLTDVNAHWDTITVYKGCAPVTGSTLSADGSFALSLSGRTAWRGLVTTGGSGAMHVSYSMTTAPIDCVGPGGGTTPYHLISANSTNSTLIATGPRTLYMLTLNGLNTTVGSVRLYDSASAPTCSSATGAVHSYPVLGATTFEGGMIIPLPALGEAYANGLAFCITGGGADTDNTSAPAGITINASYK